MNQYPPIFLTTFASTLVGYWLGTSGLPIWAKAILIAAAGCGGAWVAMLASSKNWFLQGVLWKKFRGWRGILLRTGVGIVSYAAMLATGEVLFSHLSWHLSSQNYSGLILGFALPIPSYLLPVFSIRILAHFDNLNGAVLLFFTTMAIGVPLTSFTLLAMAVSETYF